jgi:hypothetical protein
MYCFFDSYFTGLISIESLRPWITCPAKALPFYRFLTSVVSYGFKFEINCLLWDILSEEMFLSSNCVGEENKWVD